MMFFLLILVFGAAFFTFLLGYVFIFGERITLARRVNQVVGAPPATIREKELSAPFAARVIKPLMAKASALLVRVLPSKKEAALRDKLIRAGLAERFTPVEVMVLKYLGAGMLGLAAVVFTGLVGGSLVKSACIIAPAVAVGLMLPEYYLVIRARRRNAEVEASLPQILDLLTVSVEAGLGFDGAVSKVIEKTRGVLALELKRMMQEVRVGKTRREALKDLAGRFEVNDLNNFVSAVILGEQLGISIGNVMRRQADQIRLRRRQQAEERAMKAPVKMLFPLVFMIFPALFIIILGPGVIQIYRSFIR
jgi:tight adherence protein C